MPANSREDWSCPSGAGGFKAEPVRYHLYAALACPWPHRTLILRALKGLTDVISISATHWRMGSDGWTFDEGPGVIPDPIHGARYLHEIYQAVSSSYTGRVTAPVGPLLDFDEPHGRACGDS